MPRTHLKEAIDKAELSQGEFAGLIGTDRKTVNAWLSGVRAPQNYYRRKAREVLNNNDDPELFKVFPDTSQQSHEIDKEPTSQPALVDVKMDSSGSHTDIPEPEEEAMNRRTFTQTLGLGGLTLVSSVQVLSGPILAPEFNLQAAKGYVTLAWSMFNRGQYGDVGTLLSITTPVLDQLARTVWDRQAESARLGVQAEIMQLLIAGHNLDFEGRVSHCQEAIRYARLTGNPDILAKARYWHGDTYTYSVERPKQAIAIFNEALADMNSESSPLVRTGFLSDLSIAHAQMGNEINARDYAEQARLTMPQHPELDPLWGTYIHGGHAELDQFEGRALLYLAGHMPGSQYARMAYEKFNASMSKQASSVGYRIQALTRKADAARAMGDMRLFVVTLEQVVPLVSSKLRIVDAIKVVNRVPDAWQNETAVQNLQADLNNLHKSLVVVQ